jgi:hypothetical protein
MMLGYHGQPEKTREAEWYDAGGKRFIRTGDIGRFDADGFLTLFDRRKDMVISGGFNIYPSDLEAVLRGHDAVADVAVVGVPSLQWGETPVAYVVRRALPPVSQDELLQWCNAQLGKTQRLSAVHFIANCRAAPSARCSSANCATSTWRAPRAAKTERQRRCANTPLKRRTPPRHEAAARRYPTALAAAARTTRPRRRRADPAPTTPRAAAAPRPSRRAARPAAAIALPSGGT